MFSYHNTHSHMPSGYVTSALGRISIAAVGGFRCHPRGSAPLPAAAGHPARLPSSLRLGLKALLQPCAMETLCQEADSHLASYGKSHTGAFLVRDVRKTLAGRGKCLRHGPALPPAASANSHLPVWKRWLGWPTPLLAAPSLFLQELNPSSCLSVAGSSVNCPLPAAAAAFWPQV